MMPPSRLRSASAARPEHAMEWFNVTCPYCFSDVEVDVDPETEGSFVQDCSVCCRPWQLRVIRSADGETRVEIEGALG